jgi:hypothetical protein
MLTLLIKGINKSDHLPLFYNNLLNKISMGISFKKKEAIFTFRTAFPYLLLWNFSDGTGWEILHGTWNVWHKNWGYRVSVSSLYISPLWWGGGVVCYKGFAPHRFEVFRCLTWLYHINLVCGFFTIIIFIQYTNTIPVGGWVSPRVVSAGYGIEVCIGSDWTFIIRQLPNV